MTDPQHAIGDIVNGHRLTGQPDGTMVWLPIEQELPHKVGDVVNGHRLVDQSGSLVWLPLAAGSTPMAKRKAWPWVVGGVGALLLLIIIPAAIAGGQRGETSANQKPVASTAEASQKPKVKAEPVIVTIPSTIVGMAAGDAATELKGLGLVTDYSGPDDATVTAISPAQGASVEEGSVISFTVEEKPKLSLEQQNALTQAQQYLDIMPFSRLGLINQLSSEYGSGYPVEVATWAVDTINPDWNAEAAEAAQQYLDVMAFSRDGLYEQLTSEYGSQFTPEQANAGLAAVGY